MEGRLETYFDAAGIVGAVLPCHETAPYTRTVMTSLFSYAFIWIF
jgi:hypothetical protein